MSLDNAHPNVAGITLLVAVLLLIGLAVVGGGCLSGPLVDNRRIYVVPMYGVGDNVVTVPVGGVEHANTIEAKVADKLTGVQGAEISGNTASAGIQKGAVAPQVKVGKP